MVVTAAVLVIIIFMIVIIIIDDYIHILFILKPAWNAGQLPKQTKFTNTWVAIMYGLPRRPAAL